SLAQTAGSGTTTLNGAVNTTAAAGVNLKANTIAVNNTIGTTGGGVVTLNADTAGLTLAAAGDITSDGAVSLTGATGISTAGDVTTTADAVIYNSNTTLTGPVAINSVGGVIQVGGTVDGAQTLDLEAGSGNVTVSGVVGTSAVSANRLASFKAVGATMALNDVFTTGSQDIQGSTAIILNGSTYTATAGPLSFAGPVTLTTHTALSGSQVRLAVGKTVNNAPLTGPWDLDISANFGNHFAEGMNAANYTPTDADVRVGNVGATVAIRDYTVHKIGSGSGAIILNSDSTSSGDMVFTAPVVLGISVSLTAGGKITFDSTVDATTAGTEGMTLAAGVLKDVTFTGAAGGAKQLGMVTVTSAQDVKASDAGNDFSTVTINATRDVTLYDKNALVMGVSTVSRDLTVVTGLATAGGFNVAGALSVGGNVNVDSSANGGATITQSGGAIMANGVDKTATFAAGSAIGNDITLDQNNDFTTVVITSGYNVTLVDANAIILGDSTVSGWLDVTAAGPITQTTGPLPTLPTSINVTGLALFKATGNGVGGNADITLYNDGNNFGSLGLESQHSAIMKVKENSSTAFDNVVGNTGVTATGSGGNGVLVIDSNGAITQESGTKIMVAGLEIIGKGNVDLLSQDNLVKVLSGWGSNSGYFKVWASPNGANPSMANMPSWFARLKVDTHDNVMGWSQIMVNGFSGNILASQTALTSANFSPTLPNAELSLQTSADSAPLVADLVGAGAVWTSSLQVESAEPPAPEPVSLTKPSSKWVGIQ
ncbi:MAG: hypothetical protein NTY01_09080, partial [Verrucomicrobia bacterium]|nr:hypothetical protein [Verrucomicrobiota bacterium]